MEQGTVGEILLGLPVLLEGMRRHSGGENEQLDMGTLIRARTTLLTLTGPYMSNYSMIEIVPSSISSKFCGAERRLYQFFFTFSPHLA